MLVNEFGIVPDSFRLEWKISLPVSIESNLDLFSDKGIRILSDGCARISFIPE